MNSYRLNVLLVCALTLLLGLTHVAPGVGVRPVIIPVVGNDDCDKAKPVGDVTNLPFNTTQATFDGPGHCMVSPNIWYCYTATCTGCATVSLAGSSFDTMLAIYDGNTCYPEASDMLKCNDDYSDRTSQATFPVWAGSKYLIEVGGWSPADIGPGLMTINCDAQSGPPSNDDLYDAEPVGNVTDMPFDTTCATFDGPGHCMVSPNIWYEYTATSTADVTVSLCGSSFDTMLAIYEESDSYPPAHKMIDCNDDYCDRQSQITFAAVDGTEYLIEVGAYDQSEGGQGLISISYDGVPGPPVNDDCIDALAVSDVTNLVFNTTKATFDGPGHCLTSPNIWYRYTATCTGNVTVSLCGSGYDTMLAVYKGDDCYPAPGSLIGCNDDFCAWQSQITFDAVAGNEYLIEIGGYSSETGEGLLSIDCEGVSLNKPDLGDAPDSTNNAGTIMHAYTSQGLLQVLVPAHYPTVFDDGSGAGPHGPIHFNEVAVAHLGKKITRETEADTGPDQDGLNNIDPSADAPNQDQGDDGVIFPLNLPQCRWARFDYVVSVVNPGTDLWVNVWCDWNRDGDWDDTITCPRGPVPEWAVQNQYLFNLPAGLNQITTPAFISWHPKDGPEEIWMRITLAEQPWTGGGDPDAIGNGGSGPLEGYEIGETEDYYFAPDTTCSICEDLNGDGVVDVQDLILFVTEWLEECP